MIKNRKYILFVVFFIQSSYGMQNNASSYVLSYEEFMNPATNTEIRLGFLKSILTPKTINKLRRNEDSDATLYLKKIVPQEIKYSNPLINTFFSCGLNFVGDQTVDERQKEEGYYQSPHIFKALLEGKSLEEGIHLSKICMFNKFRTLQIHTPLKHILLVLKTLEKKHSLKIPKYLKINILSLRQSEEAWVKDIRAGLEQPVLEIKVPHTTFLQIEPTAKHVFKSKKNTTAKFTPLDWINARIIVDHLKYRCDEYTQKFFSSREWKTNNINLICALTNESENEIKEKK